MVLFFMGSSWLMTSMKANQEIGKGRYPKKGSMFYINLETISIDLKFPSTDPSMEG